MQNETPNERGYVSKKLSAGIAILCCSLLSGCVVLEEKFNKEKQRSLNFQRLLTQEERRTAELDSEVKRTKHELAEFEARNRELLAQVQTIREQMTRLQEEAEAVKESAILERRAMEDMRKSTAPLAKPKPAPAQRPAQILGDIEGLGARSKKNAGSKAMEAMAAQASGSVKSGAMVHVVRPGETLFRLSRRYGVEIEKLKKMNKLSSNTIEAGQRLIVGTE